MINVSPGQHHIVERLLEGPHGEVHRPHGEQRERVDADHDDKEEYIEENLDKPDDKLGVQHVHRFVLPRVFSVKMNVKTGCSIIN